MLHIQMQMRISYRLGYPLLEDNVYLDGKKSHNFIFQNELTEYD